MPKKGEIGRIGQRRYQGIWYEEFLPELKGPKGVEVYKEMSENDDVISGILFAFEMLIRQCEFHIEPAEVDNKADMEAADFVESCMNDMSMSWQDTLSEILSFLTYGWSYHEIVYKRRTGGKVSKYDDGLIGWKKLPIRAQETLYEWGYEDYSDDLTGMWQLPPPDFKKVFIPLEKALHFRTKARKDSPEGRSVLRGVYRDYYFKRRLQEIEGIGIERDLAGYPYIQPPEGMDIWDEDDPEMVEARAEAERLIRSVRRDELEGMVLPFGWTFQLLNSGSRRQFEVGSVIERYDRRMAMSVLADFMFLGQSDVGSYSLTNDKTRMFALALGTYLDIICATFNEQAIPRLIDLNGDKFKDITDYPKMTHGDVEDSNLDKFATYMEKMVKAGVIIPDEELEKFARKMGNLPEKDENADYEARGEDVQAAAGSQKPFQEAAGGAPGAPSSKPKVAAGGDEKDAQEAVEAKKSLGREV